MEKRETAGNPSGFGAINQSYHSDKIGETHKRIAAQLSIGSATVIRASEFTLAVDKIVTVTGVKINDSLDDK